MLAATEGRAPRASGRHEKRGSSAASKAASSASSRDGGKLVLEMAQAIGFGGAWVSGALRVPPKTGDYLSVSGAAVVGTSLADPSRQWFLRGHTDRINAFDLSPDGRTAASAQAGETPDVLVWDVREGRAVYRLEEHTDEVASLAFSHCSRFLATVGGPRCRRMYVWDMRSGMIVASAQVPETTAVRWGGRARDRKGRPTTSFVLATVNERGEDALLWTLDPATGALESEPFAAGHHRRRYTSLIFSALGDYLYAGSASGDVTVFSVRALKRVHVIRAAGGGGGITALERGAEEGQIVAGSAGGTASLWERATAEGGEDRFVERWRKELGAGGAVTALARVPGQARWLAGTARGNVFRLRGSAAPALLLQSHASSVAAAAWPQGGPSDRFATAAADGTVRVWDAARRAVVAERVVRGRPRCLVFVPDAVIVGCDDGALRALLPETGEPLWTVRDAHKDGVRRVLASANRKFVVTAGRHGEVRVWAVRGRELVCSLKEHQQEVNGLALYSDGRHLVSAGHDRSLLCWDLNSERRVAGRKQRMGGLNAVVLTADERHVVTGGQERSLTWWDLREEEPVRVVSPAHEGEVTCLDVCGVGGGAGVVASGGTDCRVHVWDGATGARLASGEGHSGPVNAVAFSGDGKQLVSVGEDGTVLVWDVFRV